MYRYVQGQGGTPQSTVLNYGLKTSAVNASFANGTFGHGFEMDDNHAMTGIKGGCVMIPAVLAVGEQQMSTGHECILATVIGYEITTRIALSASFGRSGHHPTGTCGPFGAATAAGKLLQFDEETMLHAISIAAGHAAGLNEAPATGRGSLKRIFGGMAAANGIRSALLAREGLTGPETMIEGKRGSLPNLWRRFEPRRDYGRSYVIQEWQILNVHYKIYAQDGYIQPMTEALDRLVKQHRFKPEDVAEVPVGYKPACPGGGGRHQGTQRHDQRTVQRQFQLGAFPGQRECGVP